MAQPTQFLPVTVPQLTKDNIRIWRTSVDAYATQRGITACMTGPVDTPGGSAAEHQQKTQENQTSTHLYINSSATKNR